MLQRSASSIASLSGILFEDVVMSPRPRQAQLQWLQRRLASAQSVTASGRSEDPSSASPLDNWRRLRDHYFQPGPPESWQPAIVKAAFEALHEGELSVRTGERVRLCADQSTGWAGWSHVLREGGTAAGEHGLVPTAFLAVAAAVRTTAPFVAQEEDELTVVACQSLWLLPAPAANGWCAVLRADGKASGLVPQAFLYGEA